MSHVAFRIAKGAALSPRDVAQTLAERLRAREEDWIRGVDVTGPGYVNVAVTPETLAAVPERIAAAGPDCARSDALAGQVFPAPPGNSWEDACTWGEARDLLHAEVTAALAAAAGATIRRDEAGRDRADQDSAGRDTPRWDMVTGERGAGALGQSGETVTAEKATEVGAAVAFAGVDAVKYALIRLMPEQPPKIDLGFITLHHVSNPAYAVRYAHARAASGVRWAVALGTTEAAPQRPPADPGELALLDALSWLPERVAIAARRRRPDEFARYLAQVADVTLDTLTRPAGGKAPGSDRLALATAARTGLAAGLTLLGVSAPDRL
jgi:arginyl-tRNA synthetase